MQKELKKFVIGAIIVSLATTAGYLIAPIEVRYLNSLTSNTTLIGLTFAVGSFFFALLSLWLGRLSDRVGRNKFLIIGCFLGIIYPLLYASTYNIFQYMGVRFVWAFSSVATGPIFIAYLHDILKGLKKKGHYISIMYAAQSLFGAAAQFFGGYLSDSFGLKTPYIAMSIVFALAALISLWQIKFKSEIIKKQQEKRPLFFALRYVFKKPALIFYFIQNTAFSLNWGIKFMLWPLIIYGISQQDKITGSVFATMGIVAFFVLVFAGRIVDKIGVFKSANISMLILGATGLVLASTRNLQLFWVAAAIYAIGEAINGPMQAVLLTENIESNCRGELLGLDAVFDNIYLTLSPFIAGILLNFLLPKQVLMFYIAIIWISFLACNIVYIKNIKN